MTDSFKFEERYSGYAVGNGRMIFVSGRKTAEYLGSDRENFLSAELLTDEAVCDECAINVLKRAV